MSNMNIKNIIETSIDLHVHVSPDIIPRKYDAYQLAKKMKGKIKRICIKSHAFPTVILAKEVNKALSSDILIGSIVLNNFVSGMNPDIIRANAQFIPFIVWFPTVDAENFLKKSKWEIRPEWVRDSKFKARKSSEVNPVRILKNGKLLKNVIEVLKEIKKSKCILATGHLSYRETEILVKKAKSIGIKKIIITHPIYQLIDMPVSLQKSLSGNGIFVEQCYSMYSIDKIPIKRIAEQIKEMGSDKCIISSDVGQPFNPDPDKALSKFIKLLMKECINLKMIKQMLIENPNKLISD